MRIVLSFVLLFSIEARAQNLADIARAERQRQQAVQSTLKIEKQGGGVTVSESATPAPAPVVTETAKAGPDKEVPLKQKLEKERVDLIQKRSALLVKLDETTDPEAAKAIEADLIALTKKAEDLKLQHLNKVDKPQK